MLQSGRYDATLTLESRLSAEVECNIRISGGDKQTVELAFILKKPQFDIYKRAVELLRKEAVADFHVAFDDAELPGFTGKGRVKNIGVQGIIVLLQGEPTFD